MKNLLFILAIDLISCNMEVNEQHWQKGNLHTHSFWSDGDDFPEMIIDWYKENDYQLLHYQIIIQLLKAYIGIN